ncbi:MULTISPECIES: HYC_CC_PP family protein [Echinicola]|uniref:Uncharacterized protein n=2 Tax=Echinicola TaxID=390846 RepID=L0G470_ECHVK|nr:MULTISPECIES: hypothetical protein [Echinicola]AGA80337.1 hypothetical protein Echvi_4136 [Echinicola vietnamensis DSM 17526]
MKKAVSIFLLIVMLLSNIGVTWATHLCCGIAVKSALMLGNGELDCGMNHSELDNTDDSFAERTVVKDKCCDNHYTTIESDEAIFSKTSLNSINVDFFIPFVYSYLGIDPFNQDHSTVYTDYSPPLLKQDRQVMFQSFLI